MDTHDILNVCAQFLPKNVHLKCILSDELPQNYVPTKKKIEIYIVNTLVRNTREDMGHWLVFILSQKDFGFFDPFGMHPKYYNRYISNFYLKAKTVLQARIWRRQVQNIHTLVCGCHIIHAIYVVIRSNDVKKGFAMLKNVYKFKKLLQNDIYVVKFIYNRFNNVKPCLSMLCRDSRIPDAICKTVCKF